MYYDKNKAPMMNKCTSSAGRFDGHGGVLERKQTALSDEACPGLLPKPLDAGIGRLLALYCPSGRKGNRQIDNNQQIHLKSWLF
jgi:hypothetical protein